MDWGACLGPTPPLPSTALPPLPDPGPDDGTASHSPDTFVQAEKLLVGQPLTLEDGDHPVMDAAGGGGGERRVADQRPGAPAQLPSPVAPRPHRSKLGNGLWQRRQAWSTQVGCPRGTPCAPEPQIPSRAPGPSPATSPGAPGHFYTLHLPSHIPEPSAPRPETREHPLVAFCTPKRHHLVLPGALELAPDPLNWVSVLSAPGPLDRLPSPQGLCTCPSFRSQAISVFTFHQCAAMCLYETCLMDWFPPLSVNLSRGPCAIPVLSPSSKESP